MKYVHSQFLKFPQVQLKIMKYNEVLIAKSLKTKSEAAVRFEMFY